MCYPSWACGLVGTHACEYLHQGMYGLVRWHEEKFQLGREKKETTQIYSVMSEGICGWVWHIWDAGPGMAVLHGVGKKEHDWLG